ncbi:MAG: DNA-directed RNA polymerase subunit L [Candidatus Bilamarchaeaceae archaeon]
MDIKFLKKEKNMLEVEIGDVDTSLLGLLVEKLNKSSGVEFAAYKMEHPLISTPRLIIKTKGNTSALEVAADALDEIKKETQEFKKKFSEMLK